MITKYKRGLGLGSLLFAAGMFLSLNAVWAQDEPRERGRRGEGFIARFDADSDGQVSADEFRGPEEAFTQIDTDGNGFIDESEAPQRPHRRGHRNFIERQDSDGDGQLSRDEFRGPQEAFDDLDANGDGFVDAEEAPRHGPRADRQTFVERLDADQDGLVSSDEFDGPEEAFERLDANEDGFLDDSEAPRHRPRHRGRRGGFSADDAASNF